MANKLTIAGTSAQGVATINDEGVVLSFNPSEGQFEREDTSLVITSPSGDKTTIENFFVADETGELPSFVLVNGESVSGADFLSAQAPNMDLATAAGPSTSPSSGVNAYDDNAGGLIDGVNRLGDLDGIGWWSGDGTPRSPLDFSLSTTTTTVSPAEDTAIVSYSNLILDKLVQRVEGAGSTPLAFVVRLFNSDGTPLADPPTVDFENCDSLFDSYQYDPSTGKLTLNLSPSGMDALKDETLRNEFANGKIIVNGGDESHHEINLIADDPTGGDYSNKGPQAGQNFGPLSEWYHSDGGLGKTEDVSIILSGKHANEVIITGSNTVAYKDASVCEGEQAIADFDIYAGVKNSTINATANGIVHISSTNAESADPAHVPGIGDQFVAGVFNDRVEGSDITGDEIKISAMVDSEFGTGEFLRDESLLQSSFVYTDDCGSPHTGTEAVGLQNVAGETVITGNDITISATANNKTEAGDQPNQAINTGATATGLYVSENIGKESSVIIKGHNAHGGLADKVDIKAQIVTKEESGLAPDYNENQYCETGFAAQAVSVRQGAAVEVHAEKVDLTANIQGRFNNYDDSDYYNAVGFGRADMNMPEDPYGTGPASIKLVSNDNSDNKLTINSTIDFEEWTDDPDHPKYLSALAVGMSATGPVAAEVKNFDDIDITAKINFNGSHAPDPSVSCSCDYSLAGIGMLVDFEGTLDITNDRQTNIDILSQGAGIAVFREGELTIDVEKEGLNINIGEEGGERSGASGIRALCNGDINISAEDSINIAMYLTAMPLFQGYEHDYLCPCVTGIYNGEAGKMIFESREGFLAINIDALVNSWLADGTPDEQWLSGITNYAHGVLDFKAKEDINFTYNLNSKIIGDHSPEYSTGILNFKCSDVAFESDSGGITVDIKIDVAEPEAEIDKTIAGLYNADCSKAFFLADDDIKFDTKLTVKNDGTNDPSQIVAGIVTQVNEEMDEVYFKSGNGSVAFDLEANVSSIRPGEVAGGSARSCLLGIGSMDSGVYVEALKDISVAVNLESKNANSGCQAGIMATHSEHGYDSKVEFLAHEGDITLDIKTLNSADTTLVGGEDYEAGLSTGLFAEEADIIAEASKGSIDLNIDQKFENTSGSTFVANDVMAIHNEAGKIALTAASELTCSLPSGKGINGKIDLSLENTYVCNIIGISTNEQVAETSFTVGNGNLAFGTSINLMNSLHEGALIGIENWAGSTTFLTEKGSISADIDLLAKDIDKAVMTNYDHDNIIGIDNEDGTVRFEANGGGLTTNINVVADNVYMDADPNNLSEENYQMAGVKAYGEGAEVAFKAAGGNLDATIKVQAINNSNADDVVGIKAENKGEVNFLVEDGALNLNISAESEYFDSTVYSLLAIAGDDGASAINIQGHDKNDTITLKGDVQAMDGSSINIDTGAGNDIFELTGALLSEGDSTININLGDGDDTFVLTGSFFGFDYQTEALLDGGGGTNSLYYTVTDADGLESLAYAINEGMLKNIQHLHLNGVGFDGNDGANATALNDFKDMLDDSELFATIAVGDYEQSAEGGALTANQVSSVYDSGHEAYIPYDSIMGSNEAYMELLTTSITG